jgi:drug/metabolite transporter (DMT)-like permease
MTGTDPALGPRVLFLGATIAGGFSTLSATMAIALTDSAVTFAIAGLLPIAVLFAAAYDYGDREGFEAAVRPNSEVEQ